MRRIRARYTGVGLLIPAVLVLWAQPASSAAQITPTGPVLSIPGLGDPSSVACAPGTPVPKSTCYVLDYQSSGFLVPVVDGKPAGTTIEAPGGIFVTCPSATTCAVAEVSDTAGELAWVVNGAVTKTEHVVGSSYLYGVSCETPTTCVVVGEKYEAAGSSSAVYAIVSASGTSAKAQIVGGLADLDGVSCASSTSCVAVGATKVGPTGVGAVGHIVNGKWAGTKLAFGTDALDRVSCGSTTVCWATRTTYSESKGVMTALVGINSGVPGRKLTAPEYGSAIACYSAEACIFGSASGQYGTGEADALIGGKVSQILALPGFKYGVLSGITCPTALSCLVTGATTFHVNDKWYGGVAALKL